MIYIIYCSGCKEEYTYRCDDCHESQLLQEVKQCNNPECETPVCFCEGCKTCDEAHCWDCILVGHRCLCES